MAVSLLNQLIKRIEDSYLTVIDQDDASNTVGGDVKYFFNKFSLNMEKNKTLKKSLIEYDDKLSKEKLKELETKYIFAYFVRHYHDKVRYIINNETKLKEFIKKEILTQDIIEKINEKTERLLSDIKTSDKDDNKEYNSNCYEWTQKDAFLVKLGHWFNTEFFKWYKPICRNKNCSKDSKMEYVDMMQEDTVKSKYGNHVSRVHIYKCSKCDEMEYFERFYFCDSLIRNKKYRRGFCGDHVDAFAAIINALDYKWRFALDDTDHIWLEIYSNDRQKWCCFEPSPESDFKRYDYNKFAERQSRYILAIDETNNFEDVTNYYQTNQEILMKRRMDHCVSQKWIDDFLECETALR